MRHSSSLSVAYKPVDSLLKYFNAAGLCISLVQLFSDSPKVVTLSSQCHRNSTEPLLNWDGGVVVKSLYFCLSCAYDVSGFTTK